MMLLLKLLLPQSDRLYLKHGRTLLTAALMAVGLAFIASPAQAAIRYVTTSGTDTGNCSFPVNPCASLTYAIVQAGTGDDIRVGSGIYAEPEIVVAKAVTITGGFDAPANWNSSNYTSTPSILDGGGTHRVLLINNNGVAVQFLTISNGNATGAIPQPDAGGGIVVIGAKNVLLRGLKVINNVASTNASGSTGGGIALLGESELTVDRSLILSNTTSALGGGIGVRPGTNELANLTVESSVLAHNSAVNGGAFAASGGGRSLITTNYLTMADNTAGTATEAMYLTDGDNASPKADAIQLNFMLARGNPTILNSAADTIPQVNVNGLMADPSVTTPYAGNVLNSTPAPISRTLTFVNGPQGNYHLPKASPAIDILGNTLKIDLDGRKRNLSQKNCTPFSLCPEGLGDDYGAYEYVYTATSVRFVALEGNDQNNNCLVSDLPCKTLGQANSFSLGGDEIRVASGTHTLTDSSLVCNNQAIICMRQGITLTGGFTLTNWITASANVLLTVLDGNNLHQGIQVDYDAPFGASLIRNFTIRHGLSTQNGGGIAVGSANIGTTQNTTISNCRVEESRTSSIGDGGGIFALSPANLRVTGCTLTNNVAGDGRGGGLAIDDAGGVSTYTLTSLVVFNNIASSSGFNSPNGGMGGGLFLQGAGTFQQSEVFSNTASMSGGGVTTGSNKSHPTIDRVYIHDNKASAGGGFSIFLTGGATLQNTIIARNTATSTVGVTNNQISPKLLFGGNAIHSPYIGVPDGDPDEGLHVTNVTIADNTGAVDEAVKVDGSDDAANSRRNLFTNVLISGSKVGIRSDGNGFASLTKVLMTTDVVTKTDHFTPTRLTGGAPLSGVRGFVGNGDYHLVASADGVDDGVTVAGLTHDFEGSNRPIGPAFDIGAFETTAQKQEQFITFDQPLNHALADSPFPVHPTASSNLPVQLSSKTPAVCTVSAFSVTLVGEGTCTLEAKQPGNATFNAAPTVTRSFKVTIAPPKEELRLPSLQKHE